MEEKFSVGDIVLSKAGRDADKPFVVIDTEGIFAYICDGNCHKADKPKKKKFKHIRPTGSQSEYIAAKLLGDTKVTNNELRRAISEFKESLAYPEK